MPGGLEIIAAPATIDGRAYFIPRWSILDRLEQTWFAEKSAASRKKAIQDNFREHEALIRHGVAELFGTAEGETFVIVGSGPSLVQNVHLLDRPRPGVHVLAINAALKALPPGVAEYYFTLDWLGNRSWLDGVDTGGVKLLCSVTCPPALLSRFEDYYHFVGMTGCISSEYGINQKYAYLGQLDGCLTGTYSAMHFAFRCGAKRIILVGQDFACRWGMYHWDEPLTEAVALDREMYVVRDLAGGVTLTDYQLERNMNCVKAACMWCHEDGVEIVNATQGGILDWNRKDLASVLAEIEGERPRILGSSAGTGHPMRTVQTTQIT